MSFQVQIRQVPQGMRPIVTTVEMSTDSLQLKLTKDIHNILSINGQKVTLMQKETVRKIGTRWEVTDLQPDTEGAVLVTAQREGYARTWTVDVLGMGRFADGDGFTVPVTRQDPLTRAPWALDGA